MDDFKALPTTTMKALLAARKLEYPRRKGEPSGERTRWEEHHHKVLSKLSSMIYGGDNGNV